MKIHPVSRFLLRMIGMDSLLLPLPKPALSESEAVARVQEYAAAHEKQFCEPLKVQLQERVEGTHEACRRIPIYVITLGEFRAMQTVEVDALTGEIRAWLTRPR